MSINFGGSKGTQKQQQTQQTDPWAPTQPLLQSVIGDLGALRTGADTTAQNAALDKMKAAADATNPALAQAEVVGQGMVDTPNRSTQVGDAYSDLKRRLSVTADGGNQDLGGNTYLQQLLTQVGDDAAQRINAQFAAAGRDMSGINQQSVGRGVTQAQLPLLLDQFNREVSRSDSAARDLYSAGEGGARTQAGLDAGRADLQRTGLDTIDRAYTGAVDQAKTGFDIETLRQQLPFQQLGWLTDLLYPAAGLGSQSQGQSTGTKTQFGANAGFKLV